MFRSGFSKEGDTHLCFLPLGHTAALRYTVKQLILTGSKVVLCESFWKIRTNLWDIVEKYKITFFQLVPSILVMILNTKYSIQESTIKVNKICGVWVSIFIKRTTGSVSGKVWIIFIKYVWLVRNGRNTLR